MSDAVLAPAQAAPRPDALRAAGVTWFAVALVGQWLFAGYVAAFYGVRLAVGGVARLAGVPLMGGYVPGDTVGNAAVVSHLLLAIVIHGGGPLQFVPAIRRRAPTFHRWTGRAFLASVAVSTLSGLYLALVRDSNQGGLDVGGNLAVAACVAVFGVQALRRALARDLDAHRRWALRLFMAAGAVWFMRLGMYGSEAAAHLAGFDFKALSETVYIVMNGAKRATPLAVLEAYFWAQRQAGGPARASVAALVFTGAAVTALGVYGAVAEAWLPKLAG